MTLKPLIFIGMLVASMGPAWAGDVPVLRPVISEIVARDQATQRSFPGVVSAHNPLRLAFQTSGRIASLTVEAGDRVQQGKVLATLDQITLDQDLTAARAALEAAEAEATLARQQYDRVAQLVARGVASTRQMEQAEASRDASAAQADSARAVLAKAQDAAQYGTLTAPKDGIVLATMVEPGALISAGAPILDLADLAGREAVVDVPEQFVDLLPEGSEFSVWHHSAGVAPITARLRLIDPVADAALETRRIRLHLENPTDDYRIGSLVSAGFINENNAVLTVPVVAVTQGADQPRVWRVTPGTRAVQPVPVRLGQTLGARVIVLDGLHPGDEIITRGMAQLHPGQIVGDRYQ